MPVPRSLPPSSPRRRGQRGERAAQRARTTLTLTSGDEPSATRDGLMASSRSTSLDRHLSRPTTPGRRATRACTRLIATPRTRRHSRTTSFVRLPTRAGPSGERRRLRSCSITTRARTACAGTDRPCLAGHGSSSTRPTGASTGRSRSGLRGAMSGSSSSGTGTTEPSVRSSMRMSRRMTPTSGRSRSPSFGAGQVSLHRLSRFTT